MLAFLRYAEDEIPVSFPYRDTGTIRESYRRVMVSDNGLANSDLPIMEQYLKKVCLTAFAESEFGNPGFSLPLAFR